MEVLEVLLKCERTFPHAFGQVLGPYLHGTGLVEEYLYKAALLQVQICRGLRAVKGPLYMLNDVYRLDGLDPQRMDLLPLRKWLRQLTYELGQDFIHLHPKRRCLWTWYDLGCMWLDFGYSVRCGHCVRLCLSELLLPDVARLDDVLELLDEELDGLDIPDYLVSYSGQPVDTWLVVDESHDWGDDPPFYAAASVNNLDQFCWRFFIAQCNHCNYRVWPAPSTLDHCLACFYFRHVLNELMTKLKE